MENQKSIYIIGGGTISWIASHLALSAPAYGTVAKKIEKLCISQIPEMKTNLVLTKMADRKSNIETFQDVNKLVDKIINDFSVKVVFFPVAMIDFDMFFNDLRTIGKNASRLSSLKEYHGYLAPKNKIINKIRKNRKDLFLIGFKQTRNKNENEQYLAGLNLCKKNSCNLVLANDVGTRLNMIITPEEARYHVTKDRDEAINGLVKMTKYRSQLSFTRSTVVDGRPINWNSTIVPDSLRTIVNYCIKSKAYKPFNGATVGHFACKINKTTFLTSRRKTNFNDLNELGLVQITTDGPDTVIAYGSKPSVGGQSQRIIFDNHPDLDCIVHFHCPKKEGSKVPSVSQYEYECGSHQCGENTSNGLKKFGNLYAVYLEEHGPNIVFNKNIDPQEVINFIKDNFSLELKTGGFVSL